eukprot:jgi/Botrbrau1/22574/Bobra.176_1s0007.1
MGMSQPSFSVNLGKLETRYKDLQKQLHPDKFSTASEEARKHSAAQSALVNEAYSTLKKPLSRAKHLLELEGLGEDISGEGTITDPELLMEVMELRQAVEDTSDPDELARLASFNQEQEAKCVQELATAFERGELDRAQELVTQLRYITRVGEAIKEKL